MFNNPFHSVGFGIYRISETKIWPAFINRSLWQQFSMSKHQFLETVSPDNIFGGSYDKKHTLRSLCRGERGLCTSEGTITTNSVLPQADSLPLQIMYSIRVLDSNTTLLYFLVNTEAHINYDDSQVNATTSIYNLVFHEANEISIDLDLQTQNPLHACAFHALYDRILLAGYGTGIT